MSLSRGEKVEIVLCALACVSLFVFLASWQWTLAFGSAVGYGAALLLGQGLLRDIVRLVARRGKEREQGRRIGCLCAESTIGLLFVGLGIALSLLGIRDTITLDGSTLSLVVAGVLLLGFVTKDYVISVRKEKDHASVIVW